MGKHLTVDICKKNRTTVLKSRGQFNTLTFLVGIGFLPAASVRLGRHGCDGDRGGRGE